MAKRSSRLPESGLIVLLGGLVAFGPMSIDMYLPGLPAIAADLAASAEAVQSTLSAFLLGFAVGMLLYGPLSDRFGRRPVLLAGIGSYVVASALCAAASEINLLIGLRFLQALGGGAASVLGRAIVRDLYEGNEAARVLSLTNVVMMVAPLVAPLIGAELLAWGSWRLIFVVLTLFGAACFAVVGLGLGETHPPERRLSPSLGAAFRAYTVVLGSRASVGYILCGALSFAGMFAYIVASPFVYIEFFGVSPRQYGYLFGLNIVGAIIASVVNARYVRRLGPRRLLRAGSVVTISSGLALTVTGLYGFGGLIGIVVPLFFYVGIAALVGANCVARLLELYPGSAGAAAAAFGAVQFGLGALAAVLVGLLPTEGPGAMAVVVGLTGTGCYLADRFLTE